MARAQTFPELGIVTVLRGHRRTRSTAFDVCGGSGTKIGQRGGSRARCLACARQLRVTCKGNLPVHMRTVQQARRKAS